MQDQKDQKRKPVDDWTKEELLALPHGTEAEYRASGIVIIPGSGRKDKLHDSGYRTMTYILTDEKNVPIVRLGGGSDVVHIEGIGGYGYKWRQAVAKSAPGGPFIAPVLEPGDWSIDCLPKSGFLRLFSHKGLVVPGYAFSSFEVYSMPTGMSNE